MPTPAQSKDTQSPQTALPEPAAPARKAKQHPKITTISNPAHKTPKPTERRPKLTSSQIAQLKTLYLTKSAGPKEIADKLHISPDGVSRWIFRLGLAKQREQILARVEQQALTKATSLVENQLNRWEPQLAELGDDTLDIAREIAANKGKGVARDLKDISTAFSNISRSWGMCAGLKDSGATGSAPAVNIFLGALELAKHAKPEPKQAEPIDVQVAEQQPTA